MSKLKRATSNLLWLCGVALPLGVSVRVMSRFPLPEEWGVPPWPLTEMVATAGFEYIVLLGVVIAAGVGHQVILALLPRHWEAGRQRWALVATALVIPATLIGLWVLGTDYLPGSVIGMALVIFTCYAWLARPLGEYAG